MTVPVDSWTTKGAAGKELHRIEGYENEDSLVWVGALKKKLNPENE